MALRTPTSSVAPLTPAQTRHLLRRTGFGAAWADVAAHAGRPAQRAVADLLDAAERAPMLPAPDWAGTHTEDPGLRLERIRRLQIDWLEHLYAQGFAEKMVLCWSDLLVTQYRGYRTQPALAYDYLHTLRTHALGNYKTLIHAIGRTPAMLYYLNGHQSRRGQPNENYARELCELFTMGRVNSRGQANYTQQDLAEIARALTGWRVDKEAATARFVPRRHDGGEKTIFGQTGAFGYDAVIDLLFEQRASEIATYVCRHLYRTFVYDVPDETIVAGLADTFLAHQFEIRPVLQQLLAGPHFYQSELMGSRIKSPVELLIGLVREAAFETDRALFERIFYWSKNLGQEVLNPPDVAGWPGHTDWVSTTRLPLRWTYTQALLTGTHKALRRQDPTAWVSQLAGADALPRTIAETVATLMLPHRPDEETLDLLAEAFRGPIPEDEFMRGGWTLNAQRASIQVRRLFQALYQRPEYQLM